MNRAERRQKSRRQEGLLADAMARHEAGNLAAAEALYRDLLMANSKHADALHMLGLLHYQTERAAEAIDLIREAIANDPETPWYHSNLGRIFNETKRFEDAADA